MRKLNDGEVNIHGKIYQTVALRVQKFRETHPDWCISTSLVSIGESAVVMKAEIFDDSDRLVATGHAEERRDSSKINQTSALENAETSAIGRALAAAGFGGTEFASADEVANAIIQQNAPKAPEAEKLEAELRAAKNLNDLMVLWGTFTPKQRKMVESVKEELKKVLK